MSGNGTISYVFALQQMVNGLLSPTVYLNSEAVDESSS